MSKIKLIASDLDGTLLLNKARKCEESLFPVISALVDKGIYFVPASGRQYGSMQKLFYPVKDRLTYLCENGALVMHLDRVLVKQQFEDDLAMELCHAIIEDADCEVLISGERTSYLIPKKQAFVHHMRDVIGNNVTVIDTPERIQEPIIKVSFCTPEDKLRAVEERLGPRFEGRCLRVTSGTEWIDFAPLGTSKGSALKSIGEALGIAPDEMMAFGDNENDRAMLEFVGHPYIMAPCNPTVLDIPAERCTRVEDILRKVLEEDL